MTDWLILLIVCCGPSPAGCVRLRTLPVTGVEKSASAKPIVLTSSRRAVTADEPQLLLTSMLVNFYFFMFYIMLTYTYCYSLQLWPKLKMVGIYLGSQIFSLQLIYFSSFQPYCIMNAALNNLLHFLARDVIYTSRAYATMSVSVCLWRKCIGALQIIQVSNFDPIYRAFQSWCMRARGKGSLPGRVERSSRAMLATARPSCLISYSELGTSTPEL